MSKEPSLTHVSVWLRNSWRAITAAQAFELMGKATVSGNQRMFICNLCGQFVTLVVGNKQTPHFRHLSSEANKECAERTFISQTREYAPSSHTLPVRMVKEEFSGKYRFDLGLIRIPYTEFSPDFGIQILPGEHNYNHEHLHLSSITYISLGYTPHESYQIKIKNYPRGLRSFWPERVPGIRPKGTLFNKHTGIRLNYDADVLINEEYLLLINRPIAVDLCSSLSVQPIDHQQASLGDLYLYEVKATEFDDTAAKFFIQFYCRLTERPALIQPIWPLYSDASYSVRHSGEYLYLLVSGNVTAFKSYPSTEIENLGKSEDDKDLYRVSCEQRQQLVSTGRSDVLQYTYLWREPLDCHEQEPKIKVTDLKLKTLVSGESFDLPVHGCLRFHSPYDGYIVLRARGEIIDRLELKAESFTSVHNIKYGTTVEVCIGLDVVWSHEFKRKSAGARTGTDSSAGQVLSLMGDDEISLVRKLEHMAGCRIKVPHALRNMQASFSAYPRLSQWIGKCIRDGSIPLRAYRLLEHSYCSTHPQAMEITHE